MENMFLIKAFLTCGELFAIVRLRSTVAAGMYVEGKAVESLMVVADEDIKQ
jgi:hypothetical protein